jgi:hypothetical protein
VGFCALSLFFLYFLFSLYFVVLDFLTCESRRMSFDKRMLLPMYKIESVWNKSVVTTED